MGILVECPKCKVRGSVKRKVCKCGNQVQKSDSKNYWIDYYLNGKRTRERIGRSKQAAENRLREVETAKAEGNHIKKNKSSMISLGEIYKWYLDLPEVISLSSYNTLKGRLGNPVYKIGEKLINKMQEISKSKGWNLVRWITRDDNVRAKSLYDRVAEKTNWTYTN